MINHKFYWFDRTKKTHISSILQENIENLLRITWESILNFGRKVIDSNKDVANKCAITKVPKNLPKRDKGKEFMKIAIATLVVLVLVPIWSIMATSWNNAAHLFFIERSKNKNVVQYDVQLMENNDLCEPSPVVVYWVLENGRQEGLNLIQKKYAYGIDSQDKLDENKFRILLTVLKDREIIVEKVDDSYKAAVFIGGKYSILKKVYVESKDGLIGMPKVLYIDLFGWDIQTNLPTKERIHRH
jgi:hypothetical protein